MEHCYQFAEHYFRVMRAANVPGPEGKGKAMPEPATIDYKTHILIGVRANGVMTVIADWPHLPRQVEVQKEIDAARDGYTTFALCTPTSILAADGNGAGKEDGTGQSDLAAIEPPNGWNGTKQSDV